MLTRAESIGLCTIAALASLIGCSSADAEGASVVGCADGDERRERHGADCLCCHDEFSVAGSIDGEGVRQILVRDAEGKELAMAPNAYGNFFRHLDVTPPLTVEIVDDDGRRRRMAGSAPHGSCNRCHARATTLGPLTTERP